MEPGELPEGAESARLLREIDITDDIAVALFEAAPSPLAARRPAPTTHRPTP
jgi:hypothetical protein